ncbi:MAG: Cation-independent mannose-6-phosphate receptor CI-MPR [Alyxoria varia]|nr:MAG: Cation-independent mannose-6-phosphate receptor CI-MPR [Alyxoria varia]
MRLLGTTSLALLAIAYPLSTSASPSASDDGSSKKKEEAPLKPCTARSSSTGSFFDLNSINLSPPVEDKHGKTAGGKDGKAESWHAKGYDYGTNFTLNFCGSVLESLEDVEDLGSSEWGNVGGFYHKDGKTFSMGQNKSEPVVRGRKLVLNYTGGSYCQSSVSASSKFKRAALPSPEEDSELIARKLVGDDDDKKTNKSSQLRRKSTVISLLCERDPAASKAAVSFVGWSEDECTYFFEARAYAACPSAEVHKESLGPSGVFSVIVFVAILVYLIGGIFYSRIVLKKRGWYQLPNYTLWAGIFGFCHDISLRLMSVCLRCLPMRSSGRKGYSRLGGMNGSSVRGRGRDPDDENRLIDQLDEEWDD